MSVCLSLSLSRSLGRMYSVRVDRKGRQIKRAMVLIFFLYPLPVLSVGINELSDVGVLVGQERIGG